MGSALPLHLFLDFPTHDRGEGVCFIFDLLFTQSGFGGGRLLLAVLCGELFLELLELATGCRKVVSGLLKLLAKVETDIFQIVGVLSEVIVGQPCEVFHIVEVISWVGIRRCHKYSL